MIEFLGYAGRILKVDLTNRKTTTDTLHRTFFKEYIGGLGFAIYLLYHNTRPNIDPLSSENVLIFAVGPFQGTMIPSSGKHVVAAKSPLTNFIGFSVSSGHWGHALKLAGWDALVIKGIAEDPTYLFVDEDDIQFIEAKDLWGKDVWQTEDLIQEEMSDENVRVAAIGPAGENLVKFANITNDRTRHAGRTGMGAVMGSKKLKAVAVRGGKKVEVGNLDLLMETCRQIYKESQGEATHGFRWYGTPQSISPLNEMAANPTRNWQKARFDLVDQVSGEYIREQYAPKFIACSGCSVACDPITIIKDGPYKGTVASVEHETIYALGFNCDVGYYPAIAKATELCDKLGMDTISTGVVIGWAMECYERGIFSRDETEGIELTFGNYEAEIEILRKIAFREGIGDLLAEGVKKASEKIGKGSEHFAMHNKGLELPGYDVRGLKACALGFMTSLRGGCHLRAAAYTLDVRGRINRFKADPKLGKMIMIGENYFAILDSLIVCKLCRYAFGKGYNAPNFSGTEEVYTSISNLYSMVTGIPITKDEISMVGERIWNLGKAYNVRERWTKKDEYPPPRVMKDPIPDEPAKGSLVPKEEFELMLDAYFEARGWTADGVPTKQKLIGLGLDDVAQDIKSE